MEVDGDNVDMGMRPSVDVEAGASSDPGGAASGPPTLAQMTNLRKVISCTLLHAMLPPLSLLGWAINTRYRSKAACLRGSVLSAGVWRACGSPQSDAAPARGRSHSAAGSQRGRCVISSVYFPSMTQYYIRHGSAHLLCKSTNGG